MTKIIVTGSSGFVGTNLIKYLNKLNDFNIVNYDRTQSTNQITGSDIIIHLAGKAHDLKNISNQDEYYQVNTELTKQVFDAFLQSDAKVFIILSSVKAVADSVEGTLYEDHSPNPQTHYGKSKLLAEQYIFSKKIPEGKRVFILRPCMIHGPENKGNLNLLFKIVVRGIPWPLGKFENNRSFCSVDNLCFIIKEIIEREEIPSGIYSVADDEPISTNELIKLIASSQNRKARIVNIPQFLIKSISKVGDFLHLALDSERLQKLTESYIVSNAKIKEALGKNLPVTSREGLLKTLNSFKIND